MKSWHDFKAHDKQISVDSVQIDQQLYEQILLDGYKAGMTEASEILMGLPACELSQAESAILTARNNKTL